MIVDYFLVKKQRYDLIAIYQDDAGYPAWNRAGFVAFRFPSSQRWCTSIHSGCWQPRDCPIS